MENSYGLKSVIIVTGGCGDIGRAITRKLAALGARVIVFDLLEEDAGSRQVRELGAVDYLCVDQGNDEQVQGGVAQVVENFGRLDVMIGNAAVGTVGGLLDHTAADWENTLRVNLIGCAMLAQAAARQMIGQSPDADGIRGKILFTSSWVSSSPYPGSIDYCASKAGLDHLVRLIAQEFAGQGIRANAVAPGILDAGLTPAAIEQKPELLDAMLASIPLEELGTPDQVADAFVFLCSRQSNYMTGQVMFVDGGCALSKR